MRTAESAMKTLFTDLGHWHTSRHTGVGMCGSKLGHPKIDGPWGPCLKMKSPFNFSRHTWTSPFPSPTKKRCAPGLIVVRTTVRSRRPGPTVTRHGSMGPWLHGSLAPSAHLPGPPGMVWVEACELTASGPARISCEKSQLELGKVRKIPSWRVVYHTLSGKPSK